MIGAIAIGLATVAAASPNPCREAELQLRCPNLIMAKPSKLRLLHDGDRQLLASTNAIVNIGSGPLEVRGRRTSAKEMQARQVVRRADGSAVVLPGAGEIYFKDVPTRGGFYWKYEHAARFELWSIDATGRRVRRVRVGPKIFYCLRDLFRVRGYARQNFLFPSCSHPADITHVTLGISRGWSDAYPSSYPGNWIDVTGLRGCFAYLHRADPLNRLRESSETDNASLITVRLPWRGRRLGDCAHANLSPPVHRP